MLTSRMRVILKKLMTIDAPVTGEFLADINNVTSRTTREDIKKLDALVMNHGAQIQTLMGKGYKLVVFQEKKFRQFLHHIAYPELSKDYLQPQSPEEREAYIIRKLLVSDDYVKIEQLADELYVSKSTVQNDLKQVKSILNHYSIQLHSRPNYGLKLRGDELKLRFCMAEYVVDRSSDCTENGMKGLSSSLMPTDFHAISAIIMQQISQHQISMSDIAINNLLIHIAIAYKRIRSGNHVNLQPSERSQIEKQSEYQVALKIVKDVEEHFNVVFPKEETAYIAIHLLGTKMLSQPTKVDVLNEQMMDDTILAISKKMLAKIEEEYHLGIEHDKELIIALSLHLKPAINRYKYGMNIRNPLLEDIKKKYPLAFETAILGGLMIEKITDTKIDENEIGYIALHIGAAIERRNLNSGPKRCLIVCASGFGTAQLIYYRVKTQFRQSLDVVGITELYKLKAYNLNNVDLIISSVPIIENLSVPVIEVNAILGNNDMKKIGQFIGNQRNISGYFQENLIFLQKDFETKKEVLHFLHQKLLQLGHVNKSYLDNLYDREAIAPTSFGNLVAIPHPITPQTNKTFLTVCTLKKAITWGNKPVQFVCLLNVKKDSQEDLQHMYELLGRMVNSETMIHQLIKASTFDSFMSALR